MKHSKSAQLETAPTGLCISPVHCEESGQDAPPTVTPFPLETGHTGQDAPPTVSGAGMDAFLQLSGQDAPPTVWWLNPLSPPCQGEVICLGAGMPLLRVFCTFFLHELIRLMLTVYRRFGP